MALFFTVYGKKRGFDKLDTLWLSFGCLFGCLLYHQPPFCRIILLILILRTKTTRLPIILTVGLLVIITGGYFQMFRYVSIVLYKMNFGLKMNEKDIPCKPTIIMANYPINYVEYLTQGLFGSKVCLLVHEPAIKVLKYIHGEEHLVCVNKGEFDQLQQRVKEKLDSGYHIFCYIERDYYNRKHDYQITELRSGMFTIAKNLEVTITPVVIDHIKHTCGIDEDIPFQIKIGRTQTVDNVKEVMNKVRDFYSKNLRKMSNNISVF